MKRLMVILIVLLVAGNVQAGVKDQLGQLLGLDSPQAARSPSATSQASQELAVWLLGTAAEIDNPDMQVSGRFGYRDEDVEVGLQLDAVFVSGENQQHWGGYTLIYLDDAVTTYVGFCALIAEDSVQYGPVTGLEIGGVRIEYRYSEFSEKAPLGAATDTHQVFAGLRIPF